MFDPVTLYVLASVALFLVGLAAGYYLTFRSTDKSFTKSNLRTSVALAVTLVWIVTIAAEILIPAYTVSVLIHGIMGAVVGYLFSEDGITLNLGGEKE